MSDEFDDVLDPVAATAAPAAAAASGRAARLVVRLYDSANQALRTRLVACLVRPLGPLALAGVAAGAFTAVLARGSAGGLSVVIGDVARFSKDQIAELARFVEQVQPEALLQAAQLVADNPIGLGTFSAAVALLIAVELRRVAGASRPSMPLDHAAARYPRGMAARRRRV
ncbi:MAG TPA: hypothetical protein VH041_00130 [Caldimonas sp.]|jgi:hypothetical protein|nr:hypothetical protein [Caldimonas sp.]HEX4232685.1 hypothetical protein [Caldimonas sp.]